MFLLPGKKKCMCIRHLLLGNKTPQNPVASNGNQSSLLLSLQSQGGCRGCRGSSVLPRLPCAPSVGAWLAREVAGPGRHPRASSWLTHGWEARVPLPGAIILQQTKLGSFVWQTWLSGAAREGSVHCHMLFKSLCASHSLPPLTSEGQWPSRWTGQISQPTVPLGRIWHQQSMTDNRGGACGHF